MDAKLWTYMQKSNGQWVAEITDLREKTGVTISESVTTDDGTVSLSLTGISLVTYLFIYLVNRVH